MRIQRTVKCTIIVVYGKSRMAKYDRKMNDESYEREKNEDGQKKYTDVLLDMIQQNVRLIDYIERNYQHDIARIGVLQNILLEMGNGRTEELKNGIYLYGSLIQGQDLMARQMFLWLLGIAEENR